MNKDNLDSRIESSIQMYDNSLIIRDRDGTVKIVIDNIDRANVIPTKLINEETSDDLRIDDPFHASLGEKQSQLDVKIRMPAEAYLKLIDIFKVEHDIPSDKFDGVDGDEVNALASTIFLEAIDFIYLELREEDVDSDDVDNLINRQKEFAKNVYD